MDWKLQLCTGTLARLEHVGLEPDWNMSVWKLQWSTGTLSRLEHVSLEAAVVTRTLARLERVTLEAAVVYRDTSQTGTCRSGSCSGLPGHWPDRNMSLWKLQWSTGKLAKLEHVGQEAAVVYRDTGQTETGHSRSCSCLHGHQPDWNMSVWRLQWSTGTLARLEHVGLEAAVV